MDSSGRKIFASGQADPAWKDVVVIFFLNPLGLLALLGIPVVLAIHLLQRRAMEIPVATMFLMDRIMHEPSIGRRFDRILPSVPLFLQLLAVLLLAWVLSEPSFPREGSVARIAIVIDSSASMWAFREKAVDALENALPGLKGAAGEVELTLLDSDPRVPMVFSGTSISALTAQMRDHWHPRGPAVDPTRALRIARSKVSHEGTVVYLTDTPHEYLPHNAILVAVGSPIENIGFTGVVVTGEPGAWRWRAAVRNYSASAQLREWALHTSAGASTTRVIDIPAHGVVTIEGAFPEGASQVRLEMTGDDFPLDDVMPVVIPQPKRLATGWKGSESAEILANRLVAAIDALEQQTDEVTSGIDLWVSDVRNHTIPNGAAIIFAGDDPDADREWRKGAVYAEAHPLVNELNWQPLATREVTVFDMKPLDRALVWQDDIPLVALRSEPGGEKLLLNFDIRKSNADTLPAFVVMLHRFVERVRDARIAPETLILESGQNIRLAHDPSLPLVISAKDVDGRDLNHESGLVAPLTPGFLSINQNDMRLLDAAVFFADTAEADFSRAGEADTLVDAVLVAKARHARADPWWQLWVLVVLAAVIATWKYNPIRHPERV